MKVVEFNVRWTCVERETLRTMGVVSIRLGNCAEIEVIEDAAYAMASFVTRSGDTWMCITKTRTGVQVFRHEHQEPTWTGATLEDFVSEVRVHTSTLDKPNKQHA